MGAPCHAPEAVSRALGVPVLAVEERDERRPLVLVPKAAIEKLARKLGRTPYVTEMSATTTRTWHHLHVSTADTGLLDVVYESPAVPR